MDEGFRAHVADVEPWRGVAGPGLGGYFSRGICYYGPCASRLFGINAGPFLSCNWFFYSQSSSLSHQIRTCVLEMEASSWHGSCGRMKPLTECNTRWSVAEGSLYECIPCRHRGSDVNARPVGVKVRESSCRQAQFIVWTISVLSLYCLRTVLFLHGTLLQRDLPGRLPKVSPLSSPEYPSTIVLLSDSAG